MSKRQTWDATWMFVADSIEGRALCEKRRVGCVIVKDNRVLGTGYNGPPAQLEYDSPCSEWCPQKQSGESLCLSNHAEINALLYSERHDGSTAYITAPPCPKCVLALSAGGVTRIVYSGLAEGLSPMDGMWSEHLCRAMGIDLEVYL